MQQISGDMRQGETASASWAISRVYGFGLWWYLGYLVVMITVMIGSGEVARALLPPAVANALSFPMIVGFGILAVFGIVRVRQWRVSRALKTREQAIVTPVTFTVDEQGLAMTSPHADMRIAWTGVTDLLQTKSHWVFVTGGMGYCVPRRFFAGLPDERAFVRTALAQMSEGSRGRSRQAAAFVAWE